MNTLISRTAARVITPLALALGVALFLRGHVALGGGFIAAVVVALAAVFRKLTIGARVLEGLVDRGVGTLVGAGLLVMTGYGFAGYVWGHGLFHSATLHLPLPLVGDVTVSSTLLFEAGIAIVVLAVAVSVVQELGGDNE